MNMRTRFEPHRIWTILGVMVLGLVASAGEALAMRPDDQPGSGAGSAPVTGSVTTPFEVFGLAWPLAIALAVGIVAVAGLVYSISYRRNHPHHVTA